MRDESIKKVLVIGSGPIIIGQACPQLFCGSPLLLRKVQHDQASRCQFEPARFAQQQSTKLPLKPLNMLADSSLGEAELLGCTGKAAGLGDHE